MVKSNKMPNQNTHLTIKHVLPFKYNICRCFLNCEQIISLFIGFMVFGTKKMNVKTITERQTHIKCFKHTHTRTQISHTAMKYYSCM